MKVSEERKEEIETEVAKAMQGIATIPKDIEELDFLLECLPASLSTILILFESTRHKLLVKSRSQTIN